jgi:alpha-galactosidase
MTKIAFLGAGSTVFARNLIGDILSFPEFADSTLSLHDIDEERLRTSEIVARTLPSSTA